MSELTPRGRANIAILAMFALVFVASLIGFAGFVIGTKQCAFDHLQDACNLRCGGTGGYVRIEDRHCLCLVEPR